MPLPPIVSSCLLSLAIGCASNLIAQKLKAHSAGIPFVFDDTLFYHFAILSVITTPVNYYWQYWLERTFPGWKPAPQSHPHASPDVEKGIPLRDDGEDKRSHTDDTKVRDWRNIFCKWFSDCITIGALLNTSMFLVLMGLMEGKSNEQIVGNLRNDMWKIIWDSYKIWPIANLVSTMYVPVEKRIVFLSFCGLLWNIYLTLVAARL
ncbi:integral membrane protein-like protein [Byssothecium circinans]|uniref:Integral membrane protein-like protein n=1 Tax=Byssothecium circinans TaxID=147558 RepID=A0A6A5UKV1_9PLEO|nr:integral membrane protein-like protein [Byssothecium circinans]